MLNNEKMISMFIHNSFLEYKKEKKLSLKIYFIFFFHFGKVVKKSKMAAIYGLNTAI